jgi:hypothetical protein
MVSYKMYRNARPSFQAEVKSLTFKPCRSVKRETQALRDFSIPEIACDVTNCCPSKLKAMSQIRPSVSFGFPLLMLQMVFLKHFCQFHDIVYNLLVTRNVDHPNAAVLKDGKSFVDVADVMNAHFSALGFLKMIMKQLINLSDIN